MVAALDLGSSVVRRGGSSPFARTTPRRRKILRNFPPFVLVDDYYRMRRIELLAPARDASVAIEAIKCGADAVYIGADSHGARAAAGNSVDDIAQVVEYAHRFNAKVYVTLNTIIYDSEIAKVESLISQLYNIGVDALIVQDMGVLRMNIPPIVLHASTQCDTRSVAKAVFLEKVGFSQIVLARELSLQEIKEIYRNVNVPLEVFVHGALCVSYSGDCQASCVAMGRSANRGECAQMCRLPYTLKDGNGKVLMENKYLLSLKDMNRSAYIEEMIEAGVSSFKIEGRLKDVGYVKNTVAYYRQAIDKVIADNPGKYLRTSVGRSIYNFTPVLEKSFNRGFTDYFLRGTNEQIASINTPKSIGENVGVIKFVRGKEVFANLQKDLNNGDGLGFFDENGVLTGFRLNKIEGTKLYPATQVNLKPGMILFRNKDKSWEDLLNTDGVMRTISVKMKLYKIEDGISLEISDERGQKVRDSLKINYQEAKSPQQEARSRVLSKTGNTIYRVEEIDDKLDDIFVPASLLTDLRRRALEQLDKAHALGYEVDERRTEDKSAELPQGEILTYHDNVANSLAHKFYSEHGATRIEPAIEIRPENKEEIVVMTTRYCLWREMGCCLKKPNGKKWDSPLYLQSANNRFRLDFDCKECRMKVVYLG